MMREHGRDGFWPERDRERERDRESGREATTTSSGLPQIFFPKAKVKSRKGSVFPFNFFPESGRKHVRVVVVGGEGLVIWKRVNRFLIFFTTHLFILSSSANVRPSMSGGGRPGRRSRRERKAEA